MKRFTLLVLVIVFSQSMFAQREGEYSYSAVEFDIVSAEEDNSISHPKNTFFLGSTFDYAVMEFTNVFVENIRSKREQERVANTRKKSLAKLNIVKQQFSEYEVLPEQITDGWHRAIATDNINFCKDVKVLVKNNKIIKFVIDNYVPLNFMEIRGIKNAKGLVTLNHFNGEELNIVEIYFFYDLEEQKIVSDPIKPGFVCFWSDMKNYEKIQITFNTVRMKNLSVQFESEPECFSNGTVCRILEPGFYSYIALGKGSINWKGTFEVEENMCIKVRLGKK